MSKIEESEKRDYGEQRFRILSTHLGLEERDIGARIRRIKEVDVEDLMNLIALSASALRGERGRLSAYDPSTTENEMTVSMGGVSDLVSPPGNIVLLHDFMKQMKEEIDESNYKDWSAKLYMAITQSHTELDANGRSARYAYALLCDGRLPDNPTKRTQALMEAHMLVTQQTLQNLLKKELGISTQQYKYDEYTISEGDVTPGVYDNTYKYIAAVNAMKRLTSNYVPPKIFDLVNMQSNNDFMERYKEELDAIRTEGFHESIRTADEYSDWLIDTLDKEILSRDKPTT